MSIRLHVRMRQTPDMIWQMSAEVDYPSVFGGFPVFVCGPYIYVTSKLDYKIHLLSLLSNRGKKQQFNLTKPSSNPLPVYFSMLAVLCKCSLVKGSLCHTKLFYFSALKENMKVRGQLAQSRKGAGGMFSLPELCLTLSLIQQHNKSFMVFLLKLVQCRFAFLFWSDLGFYCCSKVFSNLLMRVKETTETHSQNYTT